VPTRQEQIENLAKPHLAALLRVARRLTFESASVEDLVKQIFLHLGLHQGREPAFGVPEARGADSPFDRSVRQAPVGVEKLAYFETHRLTALFVDGQFRTRVAEFALASTS
jgi:hypothetical protein